MDTIIDIAKYCEERARVKHTVSKDSMQIEKYKSTLFVAISHDNNVTCSYTSHILLEAEQCILIHAYDKRAETNDYTWYDVEYINAKGAVNEKRLDPDVSLFITYHDHFYDQVLYLKKEDKVIYRCKGPWQDRMGVVWNLYLKIKDCSVKEAQLLGSLAQKDQQLALQDKTIKELEVTKLFLEQETAAYKSILDEIKSTLTNCIAKNKENE